MRHSAIQLVKRAMVVLAASAALTGGLATGSAMAAAPPSTQGINGQMVEVCLDGGHSNINQFTINGFNQNGNYVAAPPRTLGGPRGQRRCYKLDGWYWKGVIDVDWWADSGAKVSVTQCTIPSVQPETWYTCNFS